MAKTIIDELVVKLGFQLTGKDLPEKVKKDTDKVDSVEKKSATTTEQVEKEKRRQLKKAQEIAANSASATQKSVNGI